MKEQSITICFEDFTEHFIEATHEEKSGQVVAWVMNEKRYGVVSGRTLSECLSELSKSMYVMDQYEKRNLRPSKP